MARVIHVPDAETSEHVAVLMSYNEDPEHPGLTIRYTSLASAILIRTFVFCAPRNGAFRRPAIRCAWRVMKDAERIAYQTERVASNI